METTVKQRLIRFIKYKGLSQKKFEQIVGLANGYVNNIRRSITIDKMQKIVLQFPEINQVWLLTGEGEMIKNEATQVAPTTLQEYASTKKGIDFYTRQDGQIVMQVPLVPISALGSPADEYATLIEEGEYEKATFVVDKVYHGQYYAFRVDGDSMDNGSRKSFERGDIVLVRELDKVHWLPKLHIREWPYWVVIFGNNIRIKQIVAQEGETITLHSLNPSPEYTDFTLNLSDVSRLFNVIQHLPHPNKF